MENIQLLTKQKDFSNKMEKEREKIGELEESLNKLYAINR